MNNKEVAHIWAHQQKAAGSGSHFFFEGPSLYSYGYHFKVGMFVLVGKEKTPCCLLTERTHSSSTARHKSYARQAVSHLDYVKVWDFPKAETLSKSEFAAYLKTEEKKLAEVAAGRSADELTRRKEAAAQRRREKKEEAAFPRYLEEWRKHDRNTLPYVRAFSRVKFLRLSKDGTRIETSSGAQVLVRFAPLVWRLVIDCMNAAGRFAECSHVDFPDFSFENYRGLTVFRDGAAPTSLGAISVGCHQISFSELIPIARQLGLSLADVPDKLELACTTQ